MLRFAALSVLAVLLCVGAPVEAANMPILDPDFEIVPDPSKYDASCQPESPLSYGATLQLIQNLMNASIPAGALIILIVIIYAGVLFLLSPTNPGNREMGRTMVGNAFLGFLIVISAWLVVDMLMKALYDPDTTVGEETKFGPWNEILGVGSDWCVKPMLTKSLYGGGDLGPGSDLSPAAGSGYSTGSGKCEVPTNQNNPCSVTTLQKGCFGARAEMASKICMVESAGGNSSAESGSDRLNGGSGPSYSVGLWQINLTTHKVGGLDCPSAFTAPCGGGYGTLIGPSKPGACRSSIKPGMEDLYNKCVAAAKDPAKNTEVACRLYNQSGANGGFQPWVYTANKCAIPVR